MTKHYAVTITASRTELDAETYARRLGKLLDRSPSELVEALCDDTVIIEGGLSYSEAIEIQRELSRRRIPTQVSTQDELSGRELFLRGEAFGEEIGDVGQLMNEESDEPLCSSEDSQELEAIDDDELSESDDEPGAWAELFPDIVEEIDDEEEEDEADWESDAFSSGPLVMEAPGVDDLTEEEGARGDEVALGADDFSVPESVGADAFGAAPAADEAENDGSMGTGEPKEGGDSGHFDAGKIHAAFSGGQSDRPPYKPKGYDKRPEHVPLVAAVLSAIAPGAGQVFNGQPDKAQRFGWTFILIWPWIKSVRQAMSYGEKVRTYYAPRPEPGTAKRASWYVVKWWVAVVLIAVVSTGLVSMIEDHLDEQSQLRHERVLGHAVDAGTIEVAQSVGAAQVAADEVEIQEEEQEEETEYTMDDEERAQRLFIVGYHYCMGENFSMCEQLMGRVTSLVTGNQDAYRLRTWAGLQHSSPDPDRQMPEISGEVPTLEEFERQLAIEGKELDDVDEFFTTWWDLEGEQRVEEFNGHDVEDEDDGEEEQDEAWRRIEESVQQE